MAAERAGGGSVHLHMISWSNAMRRAWVSGAASSVLSAEVMAVWGLLGRRGAAGPINGPSQWVHGRVAAYRTRPTLRHTMLGYLIHHLSATGWAVLHERLFAKPG